MNQPEPLHRPEPPFSELELQQLEQGLTEALRPVDPPEGFASRVLARAFVQEPAPAPAARLLRMKIFQRPRLWAGGALAATLLAGALTEQTHLRHERERKAELAAQQFEAAMRITGDTLEQVRLQLQQSGIQIGN